MKKSTGTFYWLPRILCIIMILFISIFAADAFTPGLALWQQLVNFGMHLIPTFVLLAVLIVAWRWELTGGILFALIGIAATPFLYVVNYHRNHSVGISLMIILTIAFPFILIGILFIINHIMRNKNEPKL